MRIFQRSQQMPDGTVKTWGPWWVQYYIRGKIQRVSLRTRDKRSAEIAAAELMKKAELRAAGVYDPHEEQKIRPVAEHLAEFESVLLARDVVVKYRQERMKVLRAHVAWAKVKRLGDLDVADASRWVSELADTGLSARSLNSRIQGLKQFGSWLFKTHRLPFDPFSTLERRNEAADPRHTRRALTPEEVARLIEVAPEGPLQRARRHVTAGGIGAKYEARLRAWGEGHALVYAIAVATGLRAGEIKRLTWGDVDLERGQARVTARSAKSRHEQTVELHAGLVARLKAVRPTTVLPATTVIPPRCFPTIQSFDDDLAEAGIAKVDESGRVVDRHALRHTFVSSLQAAGVHPRVAMALARHSDINLTTRFYTDVSLLDLKGAVARLAAPASCGADGSSAAG